MKIEERTNSGTRRIIAYLRRTIHVKQYTAVLSVLDISGKCNETCESSLHTAC